MAAQSTDLQAENRRLRNALRNAELRAKGWEHIATQLRFGAAQFAKRVIAEPDLRAAISDYKYKQEPSLHVRCSKDGAFAGKLPQQAIDGVYALLGADPMKDIPSLTDLSYFTRAKVAAVNGVGGRAMEFLDAAMAEAGLNWAEDGAS